MNLLRPLLSLFLLTSAVAGAQAVPLVSAAPALTSPIVKVQLFSRDNNNNGVDQNSAEQTLRIDRLENQIRSLNGQIEQMQYDIRRMDEQLRKFQQDVDFRLQEQGGKGAPARTPPAKRSDAGDNGASNLASAPSAPVVNGAGAVASANAVGANVVGDGITDNRRGSKRGDAFDPEADPSAPGAPRSLGTLSKDAGPLELSPRGRSPNAEAFPAQMPGAPAAPIAGATTAPETVAALPPSPRDEYDSALAALKIGQYDEAESGLRSFLAKSPGDKLTADANFFLGESFFRRNRPREAAEQYLKVSTDFSKSPRAPEALVKLGLSLEKLGAKEQACATYGEVGRKYPNVSASVRASAEREAKRAKC